jgi:hypothetical protein
MQFYTSWTSILDNDGAENLFLSFSETKTFSDGTSSVFDLIRDGRNIEVKDTNKYQYLYEMYEIKDSACSCTAAEASASSPGHCSVESRK